MILPRGYIFHKYSIPYLWTHPGEVLTAQDGEAVSVLLLTVIVPEDAGYSEAVGLTQNVASPFGHIVLIVMVCRTVFCQNDRNAFGHQEPVDPLESSINLLLPFSRPSHRYVFGNGRITECGR